MTSDRLISTWECEWLRSEAELCHCIWPYASPLAAYVTEEVSLGNTSLTDWDIMLDICVT
ncbi:hypothetical protein T02_7465 [Trichinella nativa]|uniref:Uncharacterized protein n=1 Tax=Trichinella nativa TaxID=6335 RepID=A0A0V1KTX3_9BILA|nr:hypothetical protein T02_7465 [Trichinella nativa]